MVFLTYFDSVEKIICFFVFVFVGYLNSYGLWEPLREIVCDLKQENGFDFEIVSFEREPFRIQYKGFFVKANGEIRYLFAVEGRSLVHVAAQENCPEGFSLIQINDTKDEVVVRDSIERKDYSLKLGETTCRKDRFHCTIRNLKDGQIYAFSDKSLKWLDEQKSLRLSYREDTLILLLQRKNEVPLAFRFVLEA